MKYLIFFLLPSCVHVPGEITAFGGKGAYKSGDTSLIWNNERSFRDGALAAATIAAGYFSAASQAAAETTAQVTSREAEKSARTAAENAAKVEITKSNNAVKMAEIVPLQ